jgi:tetratricopeptide (TPR) repeat protein
MQLLALLVGGLAAAATPAELYQQSYDLEAKGDHAGALGKLEALEEAGQSGYVLSLRKAWLSYRAGRHADAVKAYRRAIAAAPEGLEARQGVILPLIAMGSWSEAEAACRDLLSRSPDDYYGRSRLAWVLYSSGRYAEAADAYREVLRRYPSDVDMRAGLGWSLLKQGQTVAARAAFDAVLAVAPAHASASEGRAAAGG